MSNFRDTLAMPSGVHEEPDSETDPDGYEHWKEKQEAGDE